MALPRVSSSPWDTPYGNPYSTGQNPTSPAQDPRFKMLVGNAPQTNVDPFGRLTSNYVSPFGPQGVAAALDLVKNGAGGVGGGSSPTWWQQHSADFAAEMAKLRAQQDFAKQQSEAQYGQNWNLEQGRGKIQSDLSGQNYQQNWNQRQSDDQEARNESLLHNAGGNITSIIGQGWQDAEHTARAKAQFNEPLAEYGQERGRWQDIAKNGEYTPEEVAQMLGSASSDVASQFNHSAENMLNSAGGRSLNPFGAQAVVNEGLAEAGKNRANVKSSIVKDQAGSRMEAAKQLSGLLEQRSAIAKTLADIDMHEMPGYAAELLKRAQATEDRIAAISPQYGAPSVGGLNPTYTAPGVTGGGGGTSPGLPPIKGPVNIQWKATSRA